MYSFSEICPLYPFCRSCFARRRPSSCFACWALGFTMAMVKGGKGGRDFDVDRLLNFEKRSGIKDGDIESFITKVDAVNVAIQAMKVRRGQQISQYVGGDGEGERRTRGEGERETKRGVRYSVE